MDETLSTNQYRRIISVGCMGDELSLYIVTTSYSHDKQAVDERRCKRRERAWDPEIPEPGFPVILHSMHMLL